MTVKTKKATQQFEVRITLASADEKVMRTELDVMDLLLKQLRDFPISAVQVEVTELRNPTVQMVPLVTLEEVKKAIEEEQTQGRMFRKPPAELAKPKDEKWPVISPPSIGCTCPVLHMVIPPEGMTIHCPVHGEQFVHGSGISCLEGEHD